MTTAPVQISVCSVLLTRCRQVCVRRCILRMMILGFPFLQGNYVTLTNMSEKDIERVIRYHLEPINISFQAMNPNLV